MIFYTLHRIKHQRIAQLFVILCLIVIELEPQSIILMYIVLKNQIECCRHFDSLPLYGSVCSSVPDQVILFYFLLQG